MSSTTWNGSASTDWATGANWSTGSPPTTGAHVVIPDTSSINDCALDQNRTIGSLTIQTNGTIIGGGFKLIIQSEGDASGGTEHYAFKNDGKISAASALDLEFTYNAETAADFTGQSGNVRHVTINHANADVNQVGAATFTQLTILGGEYDAGNDGLTVSESTTINGGDAGNEVARLQLNNSTATLGATNYTADAGVHVSSGGGFYAGSGSTVNMSSLDANYDGANEVKLLGTNTITSYDNTTSRICKLTTGVIDAAGTSVTITTATSGKKLSIFDVDLDALTLNPASATSYLIENSSGMAMKNLNINANATLDTTTNNHPLTVSGNTVVSGTLTGNNSTLIFGESGVHGSTEAGCLHVESGGSLTFGSADLTVFSGFTAKGTNTVTSTGGGDILVKGRTNNGFMNSHGHTGVNITGDYKIDYDSSALHDVRNNMNITAANINYPHGGRDYRFWTTATDSTVTFTGNLLVSNGTTTLNTMDTGREAVDVMTVTGHTNLTGSLTANDTTMNLGSMFIASSGTYSATSGTTTLTKEANHSGTDYMLYNDGGTFTHNDGKVLFDDANMTSSGNVRNPSSFHDVEVAMGSYALTGHHNMTATGDFTLTSGTYSDGSNGFHVDGACLVTNGGTLNLSNSTTQTKTIATCKIESGGTMRACRNITVFDGDGRGHSGYPSALEVQSGGTFNNNQGTCKFTSSTDQDIEMDGTGMFYNLHLEKANNDVIMHANVEIENNLTVDLAADHTLRPASTTNTVTVRGTTLLKEGKIGATTAYDGTNNWGNLVVKSGTFILGSGTNNVTGIRNKGGTIS